MLDHAQITGIENICPALILLNGEVFAGPGLLRNGILPSAGMGAGAAVGIASCKPGGQEASSRIGNAHRAVDKGLDLQLCRSILPDLRDFIQRQFPRTDNTGGTHFVPEAECAVICIVCLGGDMYGNLRTVLPGKGKHSRIRNQYGIGFHLCQFCKICCCLIQIPVMGKNIGGNMYVHTVFMGVGNARPHIFRAEVPGLCPQAEGFPSYIYRVRTEIDCCSQDFQILCRNQKFRFLTVCLPSFFHICGHDPLSVNVLCPNVRSTAVLF